MFTSGSTGRPKGVMIPHRGVRDLVAFNIEHFGLSECCNGVLRFHGVMTFVIRQFFHCQGPGGFQD
jgi:non-ribosomal peptide synthetase component F